MTALTQFTDSPAISRIRRNHGLEHATLHMLSAKYPHTPLAGHSDLNGFWIVGNVPTEAVTEAIAQALARLQAGESDLAIHPNCGTNYAASGMFVGLLAWLAMLAGGKRFRDKLEQLPLVISLVTVGLVLAQPLGFLLQARFTTSGNPGDLTITEILPGRRGALTTHRVITRD